MGKIIKRTMPREKEKGNLTCFAWGPRFLTENNTFVFVMLTKKKIDLGGKYSKSPFQFYSEKNARGICIWNVCLGFSSETLQKKSSKNNQLEN